MAQSYRRLDNNYLGPESNASNFGNTRKFGNFGNTSSHRGSSPQQGSYFLIFLNSKAVQKYSRNIHFSTLLSRAFNHNLATPYLVPPGFPPQAYHHPVPPIFRPFNTSPNSGYNSSNYCMPHVGVQQSKNGIVSLQSQVKFVHTSPKNSSHNFIGQVSQQQLSNPMIMLSKKKIGGTCNVATLHTLLDLAWYLDSRAIDHVVNVGDSLLQKIE